MEGKANNRIKSAEKYMESELGEADSYDGMFWLSPTGKLFNTGGFHWPYAREVVIWLEIQGYKFRAEKTSDILPASLAVRKSYGKRKVDRTRLDRIFSEELNMIRVYSSSGETDVEIASRVTKRQFDTIKYLTDFYSNRTHFTYDIFVDKECRGGFGFLDFVKECNSLGIVEDGIMVKANPEDSEGKMSKFDEERKELGEYIVAEFLADGQHKRDAGVGEYSEAYQFNISMLHNYPQIITPDDRDLTENEEEYFQEMIAERLREFVEDNLKKKFKWISDWVQVGRMGGWLILVTDDTVMNEYNDEIDEGIRITTARKRVKDLERIANMVDKARKKLGDEVWDVSDW